MAIQAPRQPVFFIPHGGGPCFFMDWAASGLGPAETWEPTKNFLRNLAATLPAPPRALLVISGHWEEPAFTASATTTPELIFDYTGFPEETYRLTWPAAGAPMVAARVEGLLEEAKLPAAFSHTRGFDHGVFIPLKIVFPNAEIPTVTLSLAAGPSGELDPALHLAAGRALAPLRDEGVLIIGSGMTFHNMRAYGQPETLDRSQAFDAWLTEAVELPAGERATRLADWRRGPEAEFSHPREEHLMPLFVAAGAAEGPGRRIFTDNPMGSTISAYRFD